MPLSELSQIHVIIRIPNYRGPGISEKFAELYKAGLSLADIAKQTGKAKNTIRTALQKAGVELRSQASLPIHKARRVHGKQNIRPFYGSQLKSAARLLAAHFLAQAPCRALQRL